MSVWDRARQLLRAARGVEPLTRGLLSRLRRSLGRGAAVTPTERAPAPLLKFAITFAYREPGQAAANTGDQEVLEVALPHHLVRFPDLGEIGRWVRDTFYDSKGFVLVLGIQERAHEAPTEPRLSLPAALPEIRRDPERSAVAALNLLPVRGKPWFGFITLDWDGVPPTAKAVRARAKALGLRREFEWRPSASGRGTHVRFRIREGIKPRLALALREALGDDPIRATIDASRYAYHGRSALRGVLFDQKGDQRAGTWATMRGSRGRSRVSATRIRSERPKRPPRQATRTNRRPSARRERRRRPKRSDRSSARGG